MKPYTKIVAVLLAVVALLHLLRVVLNLELSVDNAEIPIWVSVLGFIIPAVLSYGLVKESQAKS
ncbi:hypothetical protein [Winogradskyella vincentii]|uniref:Uncharacterized protein n=1 Tax=Winogradskyella vincentii TaxID=2877122 RepID=A0ABS7Y712_9FLAO|nr:hypothetical protein [Winogradskyella vincentii]MCA0154453.1 hypothetical protein [Winogradskyella vincentii]